MLGLDGDLSPAVFGDLLARPHVRRKCAPDGLLVDIWVALAFAKRPLEYAAILKRWAAIEMIRASPGSNSCRA